MTSQFVRNLRPTIYEYRDYRQFVRDMVSYFRSTQVSVRQLTRKASFGSTSYLSMVINGQRNLTAKSSAKLIAGLELDSDEAVYFDLLVRQNQTSDTKLRQKIDHELQHVVAQKSQAPSKSQPQKSVARHVANVFEAVTNQPSKKAPSEIAARLNINEAEVVEAIELLQLLNLIEETDEGYIQRSTLPNFFTKDKIIQ